MTKEPDWTKLPADTPPRVIELLQRCLKTDPRERLRDIADARFDADARPVVAVNHTRFPAAPARGWAALALLATGSAIGLSVASAVRRFRVFRLCWRYQVLLAYACCAMRR